jgi:hypothetical protein
VCWVSRGQLGEWGSQPLSEGEAAWGVFGVQEGGRAYEGDGGCCQGSLEVCSKTRESGLLRVTWRVTVHTCGRGFEVAAAWLAFLSLRWLACVLATYICLCCCA